LRIVEGLVLGGGLNLDEFAGACHDHIHIHIGA